MEAVLASLQILKGRKKTTKIITVGVPIEFQNGNPPNVLELLHLEPRRYLQKNEALRGYHIHSSPFGLASLTRPFSDFYKILYRKFV
jgi:hypothetical protein